MAVLRLLLKDARVAVNARGDLIVRSSWQACSHGLADLVSVGAYGLLK